jgi:hypothetical protein
LESLRTRRDSIQSDLAKIYDSAPHTDSRAYKEAQVALQKNGDLSFSEAELDDLLPPTLQRRLRGKR